VKDGVAALQKIEVERAVGDLTIIRSGLAAGQTVIVSGQLRVLNGAKVSVTSPAPRPRPAS
jgi:tRNA A37 threonylcarbamoyladenosine biosynthesis protein TsaE